MDPQQIAFVAEVTGAASVSRCERIQSLWGGYGELLRVRLVGADRATAIVKFAKPPPVRANTEDASHVRSVARTTSRRRSTER